MTELRRDDDVLAWGAAGGRGHAGLAGSEAQDLAAGVHERRGNLTEVETLRRDEHRRTPSMVSYGKSRAAAEQVGTWPATGPADALLVYLRVADAELEHLRGTALGFRDLTNYVARSLLEAGELRPRLHPAW